MRAGRLDRLVQFQRFSEVDDGFSLSKVWANHGDAQWASKADLSDAERWRAQEVAATVTTRFIVRWSAFTSDIDPKDRLICEDVTYEITGIKEGKARRRMLELTCVARSDL